MRTFLGSLLLALLAAGLPWSARADTCAVCGQPITGSAYFMPDQVTGQQELVCSNCAFNRPRCYLCGLPIKQGDEVQLPDGRYLCARDAQTAVMDADSARQVCATVKDELDGQFSRFTSFPTNVDVNGIDRIDVDSMFNHPGHDFESPDLLGCIQPVTVNGEKRYHLSLMIGLPLAELRETCAHEYSHAWVGENVSPERHARIDRDAEEGFCEMMGYLLMDAQGEEAEKRRVLANHYTRGQVQVFIAAEQRYGLDEILDWMRYGVSSRLDREHLDEVREVQMPSRTIPAALALSNPLANVPPHPAASQTVAINLQGIIWGNSPLAIINGKSFCVSEVDDVRLNGTNVSICCEAIGPRRVRIQNLVSGKIQDLEMPIN